MNWTVEELHLRKHTLQTCRVILRLVSPLQPIAHESRIPNSKSNIRPKHPLRNLPWLRSPRRQGSTPPLPRGPADELWPDSRRSYYAIYIYLSATFAGHCAPQPVMGGSEIQNTQPSSVFTLTAPRRHLETRDLILMGWRPKQRIRGIMPLYCALCL